jgi:hypothetical protein
MAGGGPRIPFSGVLLVLLGSLFLADQLGALDAGHILRQWWPAILVLAGFLHLLEKPSTPIGPMVLIAVGAAFLLANFGLVRMVSVWNLWPVALIAIGLHILLRGGKG